MLVDCLFLSYLLGGTMKWVRTKHGERMPPLRALEDFEITRSENPQKVAGQLYRDFPLAHDITFSCFTLDRGRAQADDGELLRHLPPERGSRPSRGPRPVTRPRRHPADAGGRTMSAGEAPIKQAVKWIDEQLHDNPKADRTKLIDEAVAAST